MKSEQIMALSLAELGLSAKGRNNWTQCVLKQRDPDFDEFAYGRGYSRFLQQQSEQITVGELIKTLEEHWQPIPKDLRMHARNLQRRLVELGLTQLDWVALPNSTINHQMLVKLSKEDLRKRSILLLSTLSLPSLLGITRDLRKCTRDTTIEDLLNYDPFEGEMRPRLVMNLFGLMFEKSFKSTRQLLIECGFRYEDGIFLQAGTRRQLAEDLMAKEGLSKKTAYKFADIAQKRNMVRAFVD